MDSDDDDLISISSDSGSGSDGDQMILWHDICSSRRSGIARPCVEPQL